MRLAPVPSATLRLAMRLTTVSSALSWRIEEKRTGKSKGTAPLRKVREYDLLAQLAY